MATEDADLRVVTLDGEGEEFISALSSETTRDIYFSLQEEPKTPSDIANDLDMSTQNAHYHLRKIREAELIEEHGIEYSEKGLEMTIYEPTDEQLVICEDADTRDELSRLLKQLVGGIGLVVAISGLVHVTLTQILEIGPYAPTPEPAPPAAHHTMLWWQHPSVWVFATGVILVSVYTFRGYWQRQ